MWTAVTWAHHFSKRRLLGL